MKDSFSTHWSIIRKTDDIINWPQEDIPRCVHLLTIVNAIRARVYENPLQDNQMN